MRKEDAEKTAFVTKRGLFEYLRMPFRLRNAPSSFQRALDIILAEHSWETCLIYIGGVIIFLKTAKQHLQNVYEILSVLHKAGVSLKLKKCLFFTNSVLYLGHIVLPGTLGVADSIRGVSKKRSHPTHPPSCVRSSGSSM